MVVTQQLMLNRDKTEAIVIAAVNTRAHATMDVVVDVCGCIVTPTPYFRDIGVWFDSAMSMAKEIIDLYRTLLWQCFVCFLDAGKAFDRVNHRTLFKQLGTRGVPGYILRTLIHWYKNQDMLIRRDEAYSSKFKVTNGVRQGGYYPLICACILCISILL